jgi:arylformamidase
VADPLAGRIIDISPRLSPRTAVWPGDVPLSRSVALSIADGANIDLSSITTTVHIGAHTDAPSHYTAGGDDIASRSLERYLGPCQVVRVGLAGGRILPEHVTDEIVAPRVLFATGSFPDPERWTDDFVALSPELIAWLHTRGVILVGIDTPSIDPAASKALESHQAVADHDMAILEGIVLHRVPAGRYTLVALPLPIENADASPVRAVLIHT